MEIDLTVLLNLKCEEIQEIGTLINARTDDKFKIMNISKGVELYSLSIHIRFSKVTIITVPTIL